MSDKVKTLVLPAAIGGAALGIVGLAVAGVLWSLGAAAGPAVRHPRVALVAGPALRSQPPAAAEPAVAGDVRAAASGPPAPPVEAPAASAAAAPARYSLQLGAFLDRPDAPGAAQARAKALMAEAAALGFAPTATPMTDANGRVWISVRLGGYSDITEAALAEEGLLGQVGLAATIVSVAPPANG